MGANQDQRGQIRQLQPAVGHEEYRDLAKFSVEEQTEGRETKGTCLRKIYTIGCKSSPSCSPLLIEPPP